MHGHNDAPGVPNMQPQVYGMPGMIPGVPHSTSDGLNVTGYEYEKAHEDIARAAMAAMNGQSMQPGYVPGMPQPMMPVPVQPGLAEPPVSSWYASQPAAAAPVRVWPTAPPQPHQGSTTQATTIPPQASQMPVVDPTAYQAYPSTSTTTTSYRVPPPVVDVTRQYTQVPGQEYVDPSQTQASYPGGGLLPPGTATSQYPQYS